MTHVRTMSAAEHRHTPDEERRIREAALDETLANTFPASDPPSSLPNPDEHDALDDGELQDEARKPTPTSDRGQR